MKLALWTAIAALAIPLASAEAKPYTRNVAIVVYDRAEPLDWAGPFEVYNDAAHIGAVNGENAFNVFVVSKTTDPVNAQGMWVKPSYSIHDCPKPDIVVFPGGPSSNIHGDPEFFAWAKQVASEAEIAQSVCTGAFVLGKAGMLDGLTVTTWHGAIDGLQKLAPKADVKRGMRFVDNGHVVTTAGISAGIDGSLHVVARLLGRRIADEVAHYMEYSWVPEASMALQYAYLNPSTGDAGRQAQNAAVHYESRNFVEAERIYRSVLAANPKDAGCWANLGASLREQDQHGPAAEAFAKAAEHLEGARAGFTWYTAALESARAGQSAAAITRLEKAFANGFSNRETAVKEPAFASLLEHPRVKQLLAGQ